MKPRTAAGYIATAAVIHHLFLLAVATATYEGYNYCAPAPFTCGNTTTFIQYPFNVNGRPDYCGFQDYYLSCSGNSTLTTRISGAEYIVTEIDYSSNLLYIVDATATASHACGAAAAANNTAMPPYLYKFTPRDVNVTVYINCTGSYNLTNAHKLACSNSTSLSSYYTIGGGGGESSCSSTTVVVVDVDAAAGVREGKIGLAEAVSKGFTVEWVVGNGWCNECTVSGGFCGSVPPTSHACICPQGLDVGTCQGTGGSGLSKKIIIGSSVGAFVVMLILYIIFGRKLHGQLLSWKYKVYDSSNISGILKRHGSLAPKQYTYGELKRITKSFKTPLGRGGCGAVFRGRLSDGHDVAVKVLCEGSKGDGGEFVNEVVSIGRTSHVNVVSLLGFSVHGLKRALVYDYMPNGSLDKYIHNDNNDVKQLDIRKLFEISVGVARGLEYLHNGCNTPIVHFDIKPHNILLDKDFSPKISDFGLAKLCKGKDGVLSMAGTRGTVGYIAPEVFSRNFGVVSSKSDVYSYGMMILEMAGCMEKAHSERKTTACTGGSSEPSFPHWIYKRIDENGVLKGFGSSGVSSEMEEIGRKMVVIGLWCIQTMPENRPSIGGVLEMLQGTAASLEVPPMPFLSPPLISLVSSYVSAHSFHHQTLTLIED